MLLCFLCSAQLLPCLQDLQELGHMVRLQANLMGSFSLYLQILRHLQCDGNGCPCVYIVSAGLLAQVPKEPIKYMY
jgi:hypothetical protein